MSLILKGIDLPERKDVMHHEKYIIHIYDDGEVYVGKELYDADRRLKGKEKYTQLIIDGVQAIQIPKGHGRLIDGNEIQAILIKEAYSVEHAERFPLGSTIKWTPTEAQRIINDNAPTILEAEETNGTD